MSQRLFTPTFIGLAVANFCNAMIFYLLVPTMAGYAADEFGASPAVGGALASIFFVGGLSARLLSGWLVDRLGSRSLARVAAVGYLITTAAYLVAPGLAAMFVVRLLNGVGFGLLGSALTTGVMMTIPPQRRSEGSGWFGVGLSISIGVGPFLALTLARGPGGMRAVFLTALASAALAVVLVTVFGKGLPGRVGQSSGKAGKGTRGLLDRRAMGLGVVMLLGGVSNSIVVAFLDPATRGTGLAAAASVFFLVYAAVVLVWRPVGGLLQDRVGERRVLGPCLVVLAVALAMIAVAGNAALLLAAAVAFGIGWGTMTTGGQAAAVSRVPHDRTGNAIATFYFTLDLGTGVGPIVLGLLIAPWGYPTVFWVGAALALVALPVYLSDERAARSASGD